MTSIFVQSGEIVLLPDNFDCLFIGRNIPFFKYKIDALPVYWFIAFLPEFIMPQVAQQTWEVLFQ